MRKELVFGLSVFVMATGLVGCGSTSGIDSTEQALTDADHDGVPDSRDKCPNSTQVKKVSADFRYKAALAPERYSPEPVSWPVDADGCEFDDDHDGVVNAKDYCPTDTAEMLAAGVAENGCPKQSDGDGTPDYRDNCPGTPRGVKTDSFGCPLE